MYKPSSSYSSKPTTSRYVAASRGGGLDIFDYDQQRSINERGGISRLFRNVDSRTLTYGTLILTSLLLLVTYTVDLTSILSKLPYFSGDGGEDEDDDDNYNGRYPNSLLTLFFPYTLLRDVVIAQPVDKDHDVPFFWHVHKSDELIVKRILTSCYGLDLVELDDMESIERAKQLELASESKPNRVITSPFIRDAIQIFTPENFGRMFCFFRHPMDYDIHDSLPTFPNGPDNWLTRLLSDVHEGPLGFKELGVAKHVVRETCVVGTIDKMVASIKRMGSYYGWKLKTGVDESCIDNFVVADNPSETYVDHDSEEWHEFYLKNKFDCQLYELAQSTWRAQIQTIIPYETQLSRAAPSEDEEEEEEEEEDE